MWLKVHVLFDILPFNAFLFFLFFLNKLRIKAFMKLEFYNRTLSTAQLL